MRIKKSLERLMLKRKGLLTIEVSDYALDQYKNYVREHKKDTPFEIEKYVNRNIRLVTKLKDKGYLQIFKYGCLKLFVDNTNTLVKISNNYRDKNPSVIDLVEKEKLTHMYRL